MYLAYFSLERNLAGLGTALTVFDNVPLSSTTLPPIEVVCDFAMNSSVWIHSDMST